MELIMENQYLKVTVTTWGAQIKSVIRKSDGVEHMWQTDPALWDYHAPTMFPYCDRLPDNFITVDGVKYEAPCHGFAQGMERNVISHNENQVVMELVDSEETLKQWPFRFRLVSTFTLEGDKVHHGLTVENRGQKSMPFGIGYHPGFAVPFDDKHTSDDYEIQFSSLESPICLRFSRTPELNTLYSLGTNIRSLPVDENVFKGPSMCMTNLRSKYISLVEKDSGRRVTCDISGFPYTLLWSRGIGKPPFVCFEPWHSIPNPLHNANDWSEKEATEILAPGESWSTNLTTQFAR